MTIKVFSGEKAYAAGLYGAMTGRAVLVPYQQVTPDMVGPIMAAYAAVHGWDRLDEIQINEGRPAVVKATEPEALGYMCYVVGGYAPKVIHATADKAHEEMLRLAKANPNHDVYKVRIVDSAKARTVSDTVLDVHSERKAAKEAA